MLCFPYLRNTKVDDFLDMANFTLTRQNTDNLKQQSEKR